MEYVVAAWVLTVMVGVQVPFLTVVMMPVGALFMAVGAHYAGPRLKITLKDGWRLARSMMGALLLLIGVFLLLAGLCATPLAILNALIGACTTCE